MSSWRHTSAPSRARRRRGRTGYLYVLPHLHGVAPGSAVDVFDRTGTYLGRLPFPEPVETGPGLHADGDHLYVVVTDALDVPRVERLRIERPPG